MSDTHPPYGGQPDPHSPAWGTPPGQPAAPPAFGQPGQPGYPPQFGAPVPPPQKSNKGLWLGLGIGAAVMVVLIACGGTIGFFALRDDDSKPTVTTGSSEAPAAPGPGASADSDGEEQPNNNAVTAQSASDMSAVCEGSPVLNAAPYTSPKGAKAYTFANSPERLDSWRSQSVGYDKPYYAKLDAFATVTVVGCLEYVEGSEAPGRKCDYKGSDGKQVTIDYVSSRYTLTFHAAKTGEKIGDGGTVNAPANRCPSFVAYNKLTNKAYASPDDGAIELALDKFLS